jgi:hypothetical protein
MSTRSDASKQRARIICRRLLFMGIGLALGYALCWTFLLAFGSNSSLTESIDQWCHIMEGAVIYAILAREDIRD